MFGRAKKGNTKELWNLSNASRDGYKRAIREAKSKSWTSFYSDIEKVAEMARLNRLLAYNPGTMPSTLQLRDRWVLKSFSPFKSPGLDGIYSTLI